MQLNKTVIYVGLILIVGAFIAGYFIKRPTYQIPEGKVLVSQKFLDSLAYVANLPPVIIVKDSIIHDTIWIKETHYPEPIPIDNTLNQYVDSLFIKDTVDVAIKFQSTGLVKGGIHWTFKPIYHIKEITIEKPVPYPIPYEVPVITYKTGVYLSGVAGGNSNRFIFGSDLDFVAKNDYIYGFQYRRFGNENIYGVKYGFNLSKLFKRNRNGP